MSLARLKLAGYALGQPLLMASNAAVPQAGRSQAVSSCDLQLCPVARDACQCNRHIVK